METQGEQQRPASRTAAIVAVARAVHYEFDDEPKVLDDPLSARLIDAAEWSAVRADPTRRRDAEFVRLRALVTLRSRYAEDCFANAVARGVRQCVLLGAGLDTFAYRQRFDDCRIYEVDRPSSQRDKRERLARAAIEIPRNVRFVPVDFEHEALCDALAASDFDLALPAFFSWLGVTVYLELAAIDAVLEFVAAGPAENEIVFTFAAPRSPGEPESAAAGRVRALGEPWLTGFEPAALESRLRRAGFTDVGLLTPERAHLLYFGSRGDGLVPPPIPVLARARLA